MRCGRWEVEVVGRGCSIGLDIDIEMNKFGL